MSLPVFRRLPWVAACLAAALLSGCAAQYSNHGYIPPQEDLDQVAIGIDTLDSVRETLGASGSGSVVNENAIYYVRSRVRSFAMYEPEVVDREVLVVSFDEAGVVQNVERFGLERGQIVPLTRRVTSSGVSDLSFLQQLFGNLGQIGPSDVQL